MIGEPALPFQIVRYAEIDSTNEEAIRLARGKAADCTVVVADRQSAGRGRHGRSWHSPAGNLYVSLLLRPELPASRIGELAFVAAIAVADTIDHFLPGTRAALKWPNDVLIGDAKIAGILIESELQGDQVAWAVAGVGINIVSAPQNMPYPATCLVQSGAGNTSRDDVLARFLASFAERYRAYMHDGFAGLRDAWIQAAWRLGDVISVESNFGRVSGRFAGIDMAGALLLEDHAGTQRIVSGSVAYDKAA